MFSSNVIPFYIQWLETFQCVDKLSEYMDVFSVTNLTNILVEIYPDFFEDELYKMPSDIRSDPEDSLSYILERIYNFFINFLHISIKKSVNIHKIILNGDEEEIINFLKLILMCAVSGPNNSSFIHNILSLDKVIQQTLMEAIESFQYERVNIDFSDNETTSFEELQTKYQEISVHNKKLSQELHEKNLKLSLLEAHNLYSNDINQKNSKYSSTPVKSNLQESLEVNHLKKKNDELRKINLQLESLVEEYKLKMEEELNKSNSLRKKVSELNVIMESTQKQADELDILREEISNLSKIAESSEQWRKKAEENSNLKSEIARLESDNRLCLDKISELEQSQRISKTIKDRTELKKISINEFENTAYLQMNELKNDIKRQQTENFRLQSEKDSLERDFQKVLGEYQRLRDLCEGLCASNGDFSHLKNVIDLIQIEIAKKPPPMVMCISVDSLNIGSTTNDFKVETLNDAFERSKTENFHEGGGDERALEERLQEKNYEMMQMEQKYRLCLSKAREIIRQMDLNQSRLCDYGNGDGSIIDWAREVDILNSKLNEKEVYIEKLERQNEDLIRQRELEDNLVISSWYNLSMKLTQQSISKSIPNQSNMDVENPSTSFLNRQRDTYLYKKT